MDTWDWNMDYENSFLRRMGFNTSIYRVPNIRTVLEVGDKVIAKEGTNFFNRVINIVGTVVVVENSMSVRNYIKVSFKAKDNTYIIGYIANELIKFEGEKKWKNLREMI